MCTVDRAIGALVHGLCTVEAKNQDDRGWTPKSESTLESILLVMSGRSAAW